MNPNLTIWITCQNKPFSNTNLHLQPRPFSATNGQLQPPATRASHLGHQPPATSLTYKSLRPPPTATIATFHESSPPSPPPPPTFLFLGLREILAAHRERSSPQPDIPKITPFFTRPRAPNPQLTCPLTHPPWANKTPLPSQPSTQAVCGFQVKSVRPSSTGGFPAVMVKARADQGARPPFQMAP